MTYFTLRNEAKGCHPFFCPRITPVVHHRLHGLVFVVACRQPRKRGGWGYAPVLQTCLPLAGASGIETNPYRVGFGQRLRRPEYPHRGVGVFFFYNRATPMGLENVPAEGPRNVQPSPKAFEGQPAKPRRVGV